MCNLLLALRAELIKFKHSKVFLISAIAFALVPVMSGVFMLVMRHSAAAAKASLLSAKMEMMSVSADWDALFMILTQGMGVGGIMVFGFTASWIFGREYSDSTVKDLLSLPTSRATILNAKYIACFLWSIALAIVNVGLGVAIGLLLQLPGFDGEHAFACLRGYFSTTFLTLLLGTPVAFLAIWGKGYLSPLAFVALTLVFSQIIAAVGYGQYFPWAVPALHSGIGGEQPPLNNLSYLTVAAVAVAGYYASIFYWKHTDYQK
ncbi:MAG: ABC transporter permease [Prevotellaceae bacterium]|jgi:ABC-2 type transport system permease protein|nr:ABC transporter permease [Prevotellaceae bacterium]